MVVNELLFKRCYNAGGHLAPVLRMCAVWFIEGAPSSSWISHRELFTSLYDIVMVTFMEDLINTIKVVTDYLMLAVSLIEYVMSFDKTQISNMYSWRPRAPFTIMV